MRTIFFLLFVNVLYAQSPDSTYIQLAAQALQECREGEYDAALTKADEALANLLNEKNIDFKAVQNAYLAKAFAYSGKGETKAAKVEYGNNLKFVQQYMPDSLDALSMAYFRVGVGHYQYDDVDEAVTNWEKAADLRANLKDTADKQQAYILSNLGVGALVKGDNFAAVEFLEKAVKQYEKTPNEDGSRDLGVFNPLLNLGASYRAIGNSNAAIANLEKAVDYINQLWESPQKEKFPVYYLHSSLGSAYRNIGYVYNRLENFETSLNYQRLALKEFETAFNEEHPEYIISLSDLGHVLVMLENFEEAKVVLKKGIQLAEDSEKPNLLSHIQYNKSLFHLYQNQKEEAIIWQKKAVENADLTGEKNMSIAFREILAKRFLEVNQPDKALAYLNEAVDFLQVPIDENWSIDSISENVNVLRILGTLGTTYHKRYKNKGLVADLDLAEMHLDQWMELMKDAAAKAVLSSDDELINTFYAAFEFAIATQYERFQINPKQEYLEKAWRLTEMSRSTRLRDNIAAMKAEAHPNVPAKLIQKERQLNADLLYFQRKIATTDGEDLKNIKAKFLKTQIEHKALKENLLTNYPDYYQLRYSAQTIGLSEFQNALPDETTWIGYFVGDENMFTWVVNENEKELLHQAISKDFDKQINELRTAFIDISNNKTDHLQKEGLGFKKKYLDQALSKTSNSKIIFSLDGTLNYIPLEAIPIDDDKYLIHDYAISYASSASLWYDQEQGRKPIFSKPFVGFAPEYDDYQFVTRDSVIENRVAVLRSNGNFMLPNAKLEVDQIAKLVKGKSITGEAANRKTFLEEISDYQIIHIAAHGLVDDQNPLSSCLLFSNDQSEESRLYAGDIYQLDLNAQLAVLSACNTGYGKLQRGEGMVGMSHAFNYAGVASTLVSLWSVPDKQTSNLMMDFYEHLKNGKTKDEALRQAKITFIDNNKNAKSSHPYFWAGFVLHGNTQAMDFSSGIPWSWLLSSGVVFLLLLYFLKKR